MKRVFHPGDCWLYMKLYAGPETVENWLADVMPEIVKALQEKNLINKFFYVRYPDPSFQLRVRFDLVNKLDFGIAVDLIRDFSKEFYEKEMIWKTEICSYERELERYGVDWIETAERIFSFDTIFWLNVLPQLRKDEDGENKRWQASLLSVQGILNEFGMSIEFRLSLLSKMVETLFRESGGGKRLRVQIDNKFRLYRDKLENLLGDYDECAIPQMADFLNGRYEEVRGMPSFLNITINWDDNLKQKRISDIIHMSMNRGFRSKQRMHELVVYSFLLQLYKTQKARNR